MAETIRKAPRKAMIRSAKKKRGKLMLMNLIAVVLTAVGLTTSCASLPAKESGNRIARQVSTPQAPPIRSPEAKQNKDRRCEARVYTDVKGDVDYNPYCHQVQLKLIEASGEGDIDKMREAMEEGAHPDGFVYNHLPPLYAAISGDKTDAVRLLLDSGAEVNRVRDFESTPLGFAAFGGHVDAVKLLLERGANVCYKTGDGTLDETARKQGPKEIADLLSAAKATNCR
jgi:hypothetical protein